MGNLLAQEISSTLNTKVDIGRVDIGLLNQFVIENICIQDQQAKPMLQIGKLAASIDILPLLEGKIEIHTGQLFKVNANLYQESAEKPSNFQFLIDALSSKDESKSSELDLSINSLILRDGTIAYHQLFKKKEKDRFDPFHINLSDLNFHVSIKKLTNDQVIANIRHLSFNEKSGFEIDNLSLLFEGNKKHASVRNFMLKMPGSVLLVDSLMADYDLGKPLSIKDIKSSGQVINSQITLSDLKAFVPELNHFDETVNLGLHFEQNGETISIPDLNIKTTGNYISLLAEIKALLPSGNSLPTINAGIKSLDIQPTGYPFIFNNLDLGKTPEILTRLGRTHFDGDVITDTKSAQVNGTLKTALGDIQSHVSYMDDGDKISGNLSSSLFEVGKLVANSKLGSTAFSVDVNGSVAQSTPTGKVVGKINYLDFNNYRYKNLDIDAKYDGNEAEGNLLVADENCQLSIDGNALLKQNKPAYNLHASINQLALNPLGFSEKNATYHGEILANGAGKNLDDISGTITLNNFQMQSLDDYFSLDSIVISATNTNDERVLNVKSDFLTGEIKGNYQYSTIPQSILRIMEHYLPSLLKEHVNYTPNNKFEVSAKLIDATPLVHMLNIPLELQEEITVEGKFNDVDNIIQLDVAAGEFTYNEEHYELGKILCTNDGDTLHSTLDVNRTNGDKKVSFALEATAKDDNLQANISWDNNQATEKFKGNVSTKAKFYQDFNEPMGVNISILPSNIILNDTTWQVRPGNIDYQNNKIRISKLALENGSRHLIVNGTVGEEQTDTLKADLKEINLEYVFDALNFHPVHFAGIATGKAIANGLLSDIDFDANLFIRNFQFEHGTLGNMNLHGNWNREEEGIYLNGHISELASESNDSLDVWKAFRNEIDASALTHVEGIVSPKHKKIDLNVDANRLNIHFVESFIGSIFKDLEGRATGWARIGGTFKDLDLTGNLKAELSAKLTSLNTRYQIKSDSIFLKTNRMEFNNLHLKDKDGHTGFASGVIDHDYLRDMKYNFDIDINNMLCYDTRSFDEGTFYATAYGSGHMTLKGEGIELRMDGDIETKPGTIIAYNASTPEDITDTQFITFVDKTPSKNTITQILPNESSSEEEEELTNIRVNLNINCTPDATIRVLMDNVSGDDVTCHGTGNIQAEYYNKGALKLYGTLNITRGVYKMSLQEVIRKDFSLNSGTVTFNGAPFDGQLDVQCVYAVNSASLRDLSPSATFSQKSTTRVNCLMNLTGNLLKPQISFDLDLPNVTDEDKSMVRSLVATEDQMNRQIIYLLGIGRFYTDELNQDSNQANQAMNSLLTSTISGQFNQILNQVANTNNWNFGANLNPGQEGLSNMEFQTMLSGSLFNNRLLINGNFGYRENALANTNFVGDFDIQWLLNQSGTISLKAYNETNDRYFTKNTLTTQGIGILFKRDFLHWNELFRKKDSRQKSSVQKTTDLETIQKDSVY